MCISKFLCLQSSCKQRQKFTGNAPLRNRGLLHLVRCCVWQSASYPYGGFQFYSVSNSVSVPSLLKVAYIFWLCCRISVNV